MSNSNRKFDPMDPYTSTMLEWIRFRVIHAQTHHGSVVNTLIIPTSTWENLGRPMTLDGLRLIPFDDSCKDLQIWVGNMPEGFNL